MELIPPIFLNSQEIAEALRINKREIAYYVKNESLPAWKDGEGKNSRWKARHASIEKWAVNYEAARLAKD